jgi:purine-binding chemotaxis protein CheW
MAEEKQLTLDEVRKQAESESETVDSGTLAQLVVFKLGKEEYALHIDQIKEVVLTPGIAKIPQTPHYISGVANIRGNIIAIVDLEAKFNLDHKDTDDEKTDKYTLVVESDSFKIGILVTEVPNTLTVAERDIDKSSTVLQYSNLDQDCIQGIVKSGDSMIIMVDMIKMMESEDLNKMGSIK